MTDTVAFVGTGASPDDPSREGYAMAYRHATGYQRLDDCELIACADIVRTNAERFATEFDIENVYEDYQRMVREVQPAIISVCVPPSVHADIVVGCAESGVVKAIHCEKPMAETWSDCRKMAEACDERGVQLSINHQRRFGTPFRKAKELLEGGAIGELQRLEFAAENLYDTGAHYFDLCNYYVDQATVEWVLAGIDYRDRNLWFGAHNENQGLVQWRYDSGVFGLASTGHGAQFVGCRLRLIGTEGTTEIGVDDGPSLRIRRVGAGWETVDTNGEDIHGPSSGRLRVGLRKVAGRISDRLDDALAPTSYVDRAIEDVVGATRTNGESELSAANALRATELIVASWESVRRRGRVDLPLKIDDNPLAAMVESGQLQVKPTERDDLSPS
jgi:predicted dehydrogenase